MSDKARRTYPLSILFSTGEQPSAAKLNGISTQSRSALNLIEAMIGDIWNQGGDPILSPGSNPTINALHIPNIARSVGRLSLLNSMVPGTTDPLSASMVYVDDIGTNYVGLNRGFLKYKPTSPSIFNMILSGSFSPLIQSQFKVFPKDVLATGDWSVDANGKLYTFDSIPAGLSLTYTPIITSDMGNLDANSASWNVIPDPTTWSGNYAGVKISFANNTDSSTGYHIWLPPRKPLDDSKTIRQSPTVSSDNISSTPNSGNILFFQDDTAVASLSFANHYRYNFPNELTSQGGANDALPSGFIFIWDEDTGTVIEGLSYFVPGNTADRKYKVRVTGINANTVFGNSIGNGIVTDNTTQLAADYKIRFKVITIGASLSKNLSYLNKNFWNHAHKLEEGGVPIEHSDLSGLVTPGYHSSLNSAYPSGVHSFTKSLWTDDDHPQYLHRAGSTLSGGTHRDSDDNALFNRLIIKSPYGSGSTRSLILSIDDAGNNATLSTSATTALLLSGASNAAINLINTQVINRLSFTSTNSANLANNYIDYSTGSYTFNFNGSSAGANIIAGNGSIGILNSTTIGATLVQGTNVNSGGDSAPGSRLGSFNYVFPRYQSIHVYPDEVIDATATLELVAGTYIFNNSTSNLVGVLVPVRFPNGAILDTGSSIRVWTTGNGTSSVIISLSRLAKPAVGTFVSWASSNIISLTATSIATTNQAVDIPYGVNTTVNTGISGSSYYLGVVFPVKIGSDQPKFWGATLPYRMSSIDN